MFKLITATLLATAAASLTMPHVDDLRKLQEEHLELARHLLATNPMHTLSEASHLRVEPRHDHDVLPQQNETSDSFVFSEVFPSDNCSTSEWVGGVIFKTDTCLLGSAEFHCVDDHVEQEVFSPFRGTQCDGAPLATVNYTNECWGATADGVHILANCGTPASAVWLVPNCGNATNPDFALFEPVNRCLGQIQLRCGSDGSTNVLFWQQNGCEGNPVFAQKIADDGECVNGFTLSCRD